MAEPSLVGADALLIPRRAVSSMEQQHTVYDGGWICLCEHKRLMSATSGACTPPLVSRVKLCAWKTLTVVEDYPVESNASRNQERDMRVSSRQYGS